GRTRFRGGEGGKPPFAQCGFARGGKAFRRRGGGMSMSSPARQVRARQAAKPRARTAPFEPPAPRKKEPQPQPKPAGRSRRRASEKTRKGSAFYVFATLLLIAMVFGLASINAILSQGAFRVEELSKQATELSQRSGEMRREIDDLSSPA